MQAYQVLILLYSAFLCHLIPSSPSGLIQVFCSQLRTALHSQSLGCGVWGSAVSVLCESLLTSDGATEPLDLEIQTVLDKSIILSWGEWRDIKQLLFNIFVNSELCQGRLQDLWKIRLGVVAVEKNPVS